jgi:hypothetical protein
MSPGPNRPGDIGIAPRFGEYLQHLRRSNIDQRGRIRNVLVHIVGITAIRKHQRNQLRGMVRVDGGDKTKVTAFGDDSRARPLIALHRLPHVQEHVSRIQVTMDNTFRVDWPRNSLAKSDGPSARPRAHNAAPSAGMHEGCASSIPPPGTAAACAAKSREHQ